MELLMTPTENAVFSTLAYFEQFRRALMLPELHQLLWQSNVYQTAVEDVLKRYNGSVIYSQTIGNIEYYALSSATLNATKKRQQTVREIRGRSLKIAMVIAKVKGVRSVIVMNSLAMQTLNAQSDIDFLIITNSGSLYATRTFVLANLETRGLKKNKREQAGRACLGYWLSEDNLSVKKYQTEPRTAAYWIASMVPLYGIEGYKQFIKANKWVFADLPNWREHEVAHIENYQLPITNYQLKWMENLLFRISKWRVMLNAEFRSSNELVCTPSTLKLHSIDKRPSYGKNTENIMQAVREKIASEQSSSNLFIDSKIFRRAQHQTVQGRAQNDKVLLKTKD